jgi:ferrous iron transport protein B
MYLVFRITFGIGDPASHLLGRCFHWLGAAMGAVWPGPPDSPWLSLIRDGVIGGVGGVLAFLPNILLLFAAIAVLEDSGYMARAAFIMDRWMHRIGLHGKSFIPLLIGFGCTVPAIMATRVLESRRDRLVTILVLPLISCGARFPIYAMLTATFFPHAWRTAILMSIYLFGVALALLLARLLRRTLLRGDDPLFVMELPPYRLPTWRGILMHTWERGWLFVRKAGTVILGISIILWALSAYPKVPTERIAGLTPEAAQRVQLTASAAGRIGHTLAPVMRPLGFDWKATTALIGAFAAKEVFIAQMSILHSFGEAGRRAEALDDTLRREYTPLQAVCMMLFCLISMPCAMTTITTGRETGAWRWAVLQVVGLTLLAYLITLAVYQGGRLAPALI